MSGFFIAYFLLSITTMSSELLKKIQACTECKNYLPFPPRPVLSFSSTSKILIIGQAPGLKVQQSGVPWDDASGNRLRNWLGVNKQTFYDSEIFAIVPMGFCFPGTGKSGDLPPRKECAELWHEKIIRQLENIQFTLLIGQYAQNHYLNDNIKTLTERVRNWQNYSPKYLPLPHPSPRNQIWLRKNPWFEKEVLPHLRKQIKLIIQ